MFSQEIEDFKLIWNIHYRDAIDKSGFRSANWSKLKTFYLGLGILNFLIFFLEFLGFFGQEEGL